MDRMNKKEPNLYIIAGPNGAGKTTFARKFLPEYVECLEFINADLIAGGLSPFVPEKAAIQAGRITIEQIRSLSAQHRDFGFETTLSGKTYVKLFLDLKKKGYRIHLFFLWLANANLAIERIAERVRLGGHHIPDAVVRRRFDKGLLNFFHLYKPLLNSWAFFDNSDDKPRLIAFEEAEKMHVLDPDLFGKLIKGRIHEEGQ
jgi:predicted ABC-type ATPase